MLNLPTFRKADLKKKLLQFGGICYLEQRRASTGRERDKKFHYEGSRYAVINAMVEKLINRRHHHHRVFPDFKDVLDVVRTGNGAHGLALSTKNDESLGMTFEGTGAEKSTACSGLHLLPVMPGTSSAASSKDRKRSLKAASIPHDVLTILSDDEEQLVPPAKMPKHNECRNGRFY